MTIKSTNITDHVGYITLVPNTGEIGLIFLDQQYRGFTLGKQLLDRAVVELERNGNDTVFAVTSQEHTFWKHLTGAVWKCPAGKGITSAGYSCKIKEYTFD
jgi:GNAT superfamily N-acetyltransferase